MHPSDSDGSVHPAGVQVTLAPSKCTCGFVPPFPAESVWQSRRTWLKNNIPSLTSLLSVILNIIILSALIPSLRQDVTYMQGQAASLQATVGNINTIVSGLGGRIDSANTQITAFDNNAKVITALFNETQTNIAAFKEQTQTDFLSLRATAAVSLSEFRNGSALIERQLRRRRPLLPHWSTPLLPRPRSTSRLRSTPLPPMHPCSN